MEINLRIQAAVNISAAQSGMKSNVARAPAHKYDKTDAIHSSHSLHMCRVDRLLSNLERAYTPHSITQLNIWN